jgi:hypothetical protein
MAVPLFVHVKHGGNRVGNATLLGNADMGKVLPWPTHALALIGGRAAKSAKRSAVNEEAPAATVVCNIADHHSDGIRSRCHHFRTAVKGAPMSAANASCEDQSETTDRKDTISDMDGTLGQKVLESKANVSRDKNEAFGEYPRMGRKVSETEEKAAFIQRTKLARIARFKSQTPICTILDLEQGTYKQYETRTYLPHRYIPKFCAATGVDIEWLLTGEGLGPAQAPVSIAKKGRKAA